MVCSRSYIYCTFILPYINYGIVIWGNTCMAYLDELIKLLKWAIRTISKSHYRSHTRALFADNVLNVHKMYSLELGVFMYKYSINNLPNIFNNHFIKRSDIQCKTRHVNDLKLKQKTKNTFLTILLEQRVPFFG